MRKSGLIGLLIVSCAVGGCQSSGPAPPTYVPPAPALPPTSSYVPYTLPPGDISVVKRYVTESLKDPGSATFGSLSASISDRGVVTVCGAVNAKNSYGGYAGQAPFIGILATNTSGQRVFGVIGMGGTDDQSAAVLSLCQRNGIVG
jgi:hypothetical protein